MKKIFASLMLVGALAIVAGCQKTEPTPTVAKKGSIVQENIKFSPKSVVGYVGDPMPFYDNGEMNVFYLQDGRNTNLGFHPFALMTTKDYMHYNDYGMVIPFENDLESQDFALGTGSVIKDKDGLYHCYYTGHNDRKTSGLQYFEKIQHATSTDKIKWTKHPEDGFYGGENDFRDPYVFLGDDNIYHMLITTRNAGAGVIKEYTSSDLKKWSYKDVFFRNDSGSYNMECPTFIKYNDYYYLSFSEQGNTRVTRYRYKKNLTDEWIKPEVDYIDGEGLYAGRIEKDSEKLMMFGWCATRIGEYDTGKLDWGGNLVVHELKQKENGELSAKLIDSVKNTLSHEVEYKYTNNEMISNINFDETKFMGRCVEKLSKNITRISFDINVNSVKGSVGLSFNTIIDNTISNEVLLFNFDTKIAAFYANAEDIDKLGKLDVFVPMTYQKGVMHIDLIIDGQIITAYINSDKALTTRFYDMPSNTFSFIGNKTDAKYENIKFYE